MAMPFSCDSRLCVETGNLQCTVSLYVVGSIRACEYMVVCCTRKFTSRKMGAFRCDIRQSTYVLHKSFLEIFLARKMHVQVSTITYANIIWKIMHNECHLCFRESQGLLACILDQASQVRNSITLSALTLTFTLINPTGRILLLFLYIPRTNRLGVECCQPPFSQISRERTKRTRRGLEEDTKRGPADEDTQLGACKRSFRGRLG